jgi:hypothetical protein
MRKQMVPLSTLILARVPLRNGLPKNEWHFRIILHIKDHEIREDARALDKYQ